MKTYHNLNGFASLASGDETRPELQGVYLNVDKSELCATDGYVLGTAAVTVDEGDESEIIPVAALKYKTGKARERKEVSWAVNGAITRTEKIVGGSSQHEFPKIDERFPDYEDIPPWNAEKPEEPAYEIGIDLALLSRIARAIPGRNKKVKLSFRAPLKGVEITPLTESDDVNEHYRFLCMPCRLDS